MVRVLPRSRRLVSFATFTLVASMLIGLPSAALALGPAVFINEIHYDNASTDAGEAIEVAGPVTADLTGWSLVRYNGSNGTSYGTEALPATIPNQQNGFGTVVVSYPVNGLQNGSPDGVALVDAGGTVVQFLSYEGTFTATNGPAAGMLSTDIGVAESGGTQVGESLQLTGTGTEGGDFTWAAAQAATFGAINTGQTFGAPVDTLPTVATTDPVHGAANVAVDTNVTITFSEPVTVAGEWFTLVCTTSGALTATVSGGDTTYTLDPDADFANDEGCTLTVVATQVTDQDGTPDTMEADVVFTFSVIAPSLGLVINEIDYDQPSTDRAEFLEVKNVSSEAMDLTDWSLKFVNGSNGLPYRTVDFPGVILAAGEYFVVCGDAENTPNCDLDVLPDSNLIQNGAPDAVALLAPGGAIADTVSYEGSVTGYTEGTGATGDTTAANIGISRSPDGVDTNDNSADFALRCITPGEPNSASGADCFPPQCTVAPVAISFVQGDGASTPCDGAPVTIEGVVVGDYEGPSPNLRGFYVQEEDDQHDGDPATSEGIFVFNGNADSVNLGDLVSVSGTATEFQDQTQITSVTDITVLSSGNTVTPASAALPLPSDDYLERFEGMLVEFEQTLFVTEIFFLGRFGQVTVSSGDRLPQPTAVEEPGADAVAQQAANNLNQLIVDDHLNVQNPDPILFGGGGNPMTATNPLRGGDTLTGAVGVMTYTWGGSFSSPNAYRLRPVGDLSDSGLVEGGGVPVFVPANPRPEGPPDVGGSLQFASFNVLNYFLTPDTGVDECGPDGFPQDCRGADNLDELDRQRAKLLAALLELDADVVGLIELENTTGVEPLADIVTGLNDVMGAGTYDYVDTGTIGEDVIKVGMIYKPDSVTPVGEYAVLDFGDGLNRPALAQSFAENANGEVVTAVVNHFKSKSCRDATGGNTDQGDGQGCYNPARVAAATAEVAWLATYPTGIVDDDVLVLGDLNSYAREDPIDVFIDAGYIDLAGDDAYSYVFGGQWGYLDYSLASASLHAQVVGAAEYHINADEPVILDYNTEFKSAAQLASLYAADEYRTSDHDPAVVGLALSSFEADTTASPNRLWPPNHMYRKVRVSAETTGGDALDVLIVDVVSSEADSGLDPEDVPNDIVVTGADEVKLRAERFALEGRTYTITALVTSAGGQVKLVTATVFVPHDRRDR